jgi:alpha,alpha-trehalose phosphorylase
MTSVTPEQLDAVLVSLDGVLTSTEAAQVQSWADTLSDFLTRLDGERGTTSSPFSEADDDVDRLAQLPRFEAARAVLAARGIELPDGTRTAQPDELSVWGLANAKRRRLEELLAEFGVENFPGSIAWIRQLRDAGVRCALVTASKDARSAMAYAGVTDLFDAAVDGRRAEREGLRRPPAPDMLLAAAADLGVDPARAVVVEADPAGVQAGRDAGFGLVVGVDRGGMGQALLDAGASVVVNDLAELIEASPEATPPPGPKVHRLLESAQRILAATDYPSDPHRLVERAVNPAFVGQTETLFGNANGYLGIRASHEEGRPSYQPGTLLNGFYETRPIHYAEDAVGFARTGQSILSVPDGTRIRIFVDDEPLDAVGCEVHDYSRTLEMDTASLDRSLTYALPDGRRFAVRSRRFVSLAHRHLACLWYEVTALDADTTVTLVSELVTHYRKKDYGTSDPRRGLGFSEGVYEHVGEEVDAQRDGARAVLALRTSRSRLTVAAGMDHQVDGDEVVHLGTTTDGDCATVRYRVEARVGRPVRMVKWLAYHHGPEEPGELTFRATMTLDRALARGYEEERRRHEAEARAFWMRSDVEVDGAPMLQQAIRYSLFSLLQATHRAEGFGVPAKGVSGLGYEGHYFWDTEIYVLPFLTYTNPALARTLLLFRYRMLDAARVRAREVNQAGALFPWRTISGEEASAYYAAGTAQYHIDADIAHAVCQYVEVTDDDDFLFRYGAEILVETARLWRDLGFFSDRHDGAFVINAVTGPDEYTTVVNNNCFTNLMAAENLRSAATAVARLEREAPDLYQGLVARTQLQPEEPEQWRRAAEAMYVPFDAERHLHLQDEAFLDREPWDFAATPMEHYPLLLHYHPLVIYRHQVIKQADVVLATVLLPHRFTAEDKRAIFDYYDALTTGDSSLSESIQSIAAAEIGEMRAAEEYLVDAVSVDVADRAGNVRDGVHVASAGGSWMAVVFGLGGMRHAKDVVSFRPRLTERLHHVGFSVRVHGSLLRVDIGERTTRYHVLDGNPVRITHFGEPHSVPAEHPLELPTGVGEGARPAGPPAWHGQGHR